MLAEIFFLLKKDSSLFVTKRLKSLAFFVVSSICPVHSKRYVLIWLISLYEDGCASNYILTCAGCGNKNEIGMSAEYNIVTWCLSRR